MRSDDGGAEETLLKHRKTEDGEDDEGDMVAGKVEEFGMRKTQRKAGPMEPTKEDNGRTREDPSTL